MIPNSLFPLVCALLANVTAQVAKLFPNVNTTELKSNKQ